MLLPCGRIIKLMISADPRVAAVVIVCRFYDLFDDVLQVWLDSITYTAIQQLFISSIPHDETTRFLTQMLAAKVVSAFASVIMTRILLNKERLLKKKMRMKMTEMLWTSFYSLDFATQSDTRILRDFTTAEGLFKRSVIRTCTDIMEIIEAVGKVIVYCTLLVYHVLAMGWPLVTALLALVGTEVYFANCFPFLVHG